MESVKSVAERMVDVVSKLEAAVQGATFLFVSHGDPLLILQCVFAGRDIALHRTLPALRPAELRKLSSSSCAVS